MWAPRLSLRLTISLGQAHRMHPGELRNAGSGSVPTFTQSTDLPSAFASIEVDMLLHLSGRSPRMYIIGFFGAGALALVFEAVPAAALSVFSGI